MTEMEKKILPAIMACRLVPVAFSTSTVPVGIAFSAIVPSLSAVVFASVVSFFSPPLRAANELKVGSVMERRLSFPTRYPRL